MRKFRQPVDLLKQPSADLTPISVNYDIVWSVATDEIPMLIEALERLVPEAS